MGNDGARSRTLTFFLCLFLGYLGIHRFYTGKVWTGIIYLLTAGIAGIGVIVDLIRIGIGGFPDGDGYALSAWSPAGCAIAIVLLVLGAIGGIISIFLVLI
jgi:TM2 domain-containing membrane protein YozV